MGTSDTYQLSATTENTDEGPRIQTEQSFLQGYAGTAIADFGRGALGVSKFSFSLGVGLGNPRSDPATDDETDTLRRPAVSEGRPDGGVLAVANRAATEELDDARLTVGVNAAGLRLGGPVGFLTVALDVDKLLAGVELCRRPFASVMAPRAVLADDAKLEE